MEVISKEAWAQRYAKHLEPRIGLPLAESAAALAVVQGVADRHPIPEEAAESVADELSVTEHEGATCD